MAATDVGTAKMSLTLDLSQWSVAIERAEQSQKKLSATSTAEAGKMTAAQRRVEQSLERQIAKVGLTREEWLAFNIATRTTGDTQTRMFKQLNDNSAALDRQRQSVGKTTNAINQYGLSAKQQVAAMRQVPAQMTDIFVSLQGGQNPMTVLIQQGGQLKDVFGGVVPAARALGGAVAGLINPFTVAAGVIGLFGFAALSAEKRQNAFNQALILTGRDGELSAEQLSRLTNELDEIAGVTSRQAAAALTEVAGNGRIAAEQYELVTRAAVAMQDAVGTAVADTVGEYADLARDPVNAVLRLNETERFLTAEIYNRIHAMQEAGDIEGAAALATETRAAAQIERAADVVESLGLVSGAWHGIKNATGEAWDEAVSYFDNLDQEAKGAVDTLAQVWAQLRSGGVGGMFGLQAALNPTTVATPAAAAGGVSNPAINSQVQKQLDAIKAGNRSREERQELEEQQIINLHRQLGLAVDSKEVQDALLASRKRYEESKGKERDGGAASLANAEAKAALDIIKNNEALQRAEIKNTSRVLEAEYAARRVPVEDYYARQRQLIQADASAQEESLLQQINFLQSRNVAGKDAVGVAREMAALEAKLAQVRADSATTLVILGIQEETLADKRQRAIDSYRDSLDESNEAARRSVEASVARVSMGQQEADQMQKVADIIARGAQEQRKLARDLAETGDQAAYEQRLLLLQEFVDEQIAIVEGGYDAMREAESDWLNGLASGIEDWMAATADVAGQINKITVQALDGASNALTDFAVHGKSTIGDLLADIGEEIVRFMMKQAVLEFAQMFLGSFMGGSNYNFAGDANYQAALAGPVYNAKGNAYSGSPSLSEYSGTIVNKPTPFYFAKGAGVMGEAGYEGIFPLERDSNGELGVKAIGGGGSGPVSVNVGVTINNEGGVSTTTSTDGERASLYKQFASDMANIAQKEINNAMRQGGSLWKAGIS